MARRNIVSCVVTDGHDSDAVAVVDGQLLLCCCCCHSAAALDDDDDDDDDDDGDMHSFD